MCTSSILRFEDLCSELDETIRVTETSKDMGHIVCQYIYIYIYIYIYYIYIYIYIYILYIYIYYCNIKSTLALHVINILTSLIDTSEDFCC